VVTLGGISPFFILVMIRVATFSAAALVLNPSLPVKPDLLGGLHILETKARKTILGNKINSHT
jgi:multisubunit Na+/H+ antiporter MnhE subunit